MLHRAAAAAAVPGIQVGSFIISHLRIELSKGYSDNVISAEESNTVFLIKKVEESMKLFLR